MACAGIDRVALGSTRTRVYLVLRMHRLRARRAKNKSARNQLGMA